MTYIYGITDALGVPHSLAQEGAKAANYLKGAAVSAGTTVVNNLAKVAFPALGALNNCRKKYVGKKVLCAAGFALLASTGKIASKVYQYLLLDLELYVAFPNKPHIYPHISFD